MLIFLSLLCPLMLSLTTIVIRTYPASSGLMLRHTLVKRVPTHATSMDLHLGKLVISCLASAGLQQGLSASCSCLVRSRCWMLGWHSLRSWLQVLTTVPADPCSTSLGSRWAVSTSSFSCDRQF